MEIVAGTDLLALGQGPLVRNQKLRFGRLCKGERKYCTLVRVIPDRGSSAVRLHDFLYDSETQAHAGSFDTPASPKPFEYPLLLVDWNSRTLVGNVHATVRQHFYRHLLPHWRVGNRILDEISDRVLDRVSISLYVDGLIGSCESKNPAPFDDPRRQCSNNRSGRGLKIHRFRRVERNRV